MKIFSVLVLAAVAVSSASAASARGYGYRPHYGDVIVGSAIGTVLACEVVGCGPQVVYVPQQPTIVYEQPQQICNVTVDHYGRTTRTCWLQNRTTIPACAPGVTPFDPYTGQRRCAN